MKVYITHTSYCTGWRLDKVLEGTNFAKAQRTSMFSRLSKEQKTAMLDWDVKKPNWQRHVELCMENDFEVVMAPDFYPGDEVEDLLRKVEILEKYCPRVVIPCHAFNSRFTGYELAYPMASGFNQVKKNYWLWNFHKWVTHLLGGSPHAQLRMAQFFPNLRSVDGNQIFRVAIDYGKFWENGKWVKENGLTNEECFTKSVKNVDEAWKKLES